MTRMTRGDILIVVPCLNEAAHLARLLDTLTTESPDALIVVADGGSSDGSIAIAAGVAAGNDRVILLDNPARLQSAGINLAVERHGGAARWLVRVDAHCGYPARYVSGLIAAATRTGADAVVVPMRTTGIGCFQRAAAAAQNSIMGTGGSPHRHVGAGQWVDHGHHALCGLERFRALGGYDAGFACNEDAELDYRLTAAGGRIWLEPSLALEYHPRARAGKLWLQYYRYGIGRAMTLMRHAMPMKLRQKVPLAVPPALLLALVSPLWWPLALPALLWGAACLVFGALRGLRERDRCAMLSGIAAMIMHAAWSLGFLYGRFIAGPSPRRTGIKHNM